ncbi:hypothetical protein [Vibrio sp. SCSIO 43137]|uniref:hypothetical protein n=1 Tax=Vibrio sp. SCSIO 43137 TaxID=3021011 RepID=UPI00230781A2|nr:hypothetical protein [Vibrio sp. SCSIO 43137]WCE28350.1 hypothetical protein PK654_08125 [Vibrio sp. SCSIO 43137]
MTLFRRIYILSIVLFVVFNLLVLLLEWNVSGISNEFIEIAAYVLMMVVGLYCSFNSFRLYRFFMLTLLVFYVAIYINFLPFHAFGFSIGMFAFWMVVFLPIPICIAILIKKNGFGQ